MSIELSEGAKGRIVALVTVLDTVAQYGDCDFRDKMDWAAFDQAFTLRGPGDHYDHSLNEWFLDRVIAMFENNVLSEYCQMLQMSPKAALAMLTNSFPMYMGLVKRLADRTKTPDLTAKFLSALRCGLLQPDDCSSSTCEHRDRLIDYLAKYGRTLLQSLESDPTAVRRDECIQCLHLLSLASAREVKRTWRTLLEDVIAEKTVQIVDDLSESHLENALRWKERVLDTFCRAVLSRSDREITARSDVRGEVDDWCQQLELLLLSSCGQHLIDNLFNLIVEYPDSRPALQDLRLCLHRGNTKELKQQLVSKAKTMLELKLHHAGTRTEDMLTILVATIRSFCTLFAKNEQGPIVLDVIRDTLRCLQRRKDSVSALVAEVTQPSASSNLFGQREEEHPDDESSDDEHEKDDQQPNALNVLLSTLNLAEIIRAYRATLADSIFQKTDYDCTPETEVLERMKRIFGEEALSTCDVMLRDIQQSRRIDSWIRDQRGRSGEAKRSEGNTFSVISHTCWPDLEVAKESVFECHPSLQGVMDAYTADFKKMKPNQTLKWLPQCGYVNLDISLRSSNGPVVVSHRLGFAAASVVLHLREAAKEVVEIAELAAQMKATEGFVKQQLQANSPAVFLFPSENKVALQKEEQGTNAYAFEEEGPASEAPSGMSLKEIETFGKLVFNMLKTGGKKTAKQIENSMKMFGGYTGSSDDVVLFLGYLVSKGTIASPDAVHYTAVTK